MTKIRHHSQFLLRLVNDVLALSRLDAKKMSMELATVNIDEVVAHAQSQIEQLNRQNRLQVCWDVEPGLPDDCHRSQPSSKKFCKILSAMLLNLRRRGRSSLRVRNLRELDRVEFTHRRYGHRH